MELCSEGSVYDLLCRPENFYGFPETQFVEFFADFGELCQPQLLLLSSNPSPMILKNRFLE